MVESKLVELVVAGSNPVGHPTFSGFGATVRNGKFVRAEHTFPTKHERTHFPEIPRQRV